MHVEHALRRGGRWADCAMSTGRRRHSTTALCAGPNAASGKHFQRARGSRRCAGRLFIDSSCSRSTAAQAAGKGGLGSWYRPHEGRTKHQSPCRQRRERPSHVLLLTPGNVHDSKIARLCIEALPSSAELVVDKGYDSKALRDWLDERGTQAVIPPRKNRKSNTTTIEPSTSSATSSSACSAASRTGAASPTRFDRSITNFMGAVALAAAATWWL